MIRDWIAALTDSLSMPDSEKAVQEIIQQPLLQGTNDPSIEFSEALMNVSKALKRVAEEKAAAQAEAVQWKHKYETERARNLYLEQKGGHFSKSNIESTRGSEDQSLLPEKNRKHFEFCSGEDGICAYKVITKHDVVSFDNGNITTAECCRKQISLKWDSPPQTVLVLAKPNSISVQNLCLEIVRWLKEQKKLNIFVEPIVKAELLAESSYYSFLQTWQDQKDMLLMHTKVDLVVTLGGDGTLLWQAASMFKGPVPPMVPISVGSLGFMTPFHILVQYHYSFKVVFLFSNICLVGL
ncbi:NAD(H) kinase 1-like isoform X2 [Andrographis paniculata]|uniref:NAD(H) kinase 1-like isoform X2 n=3 Tax=Andrographis paniculata TaxID=175694 RepID=UPI0021E934CB|nr:NAD(H) kinase 1-like isoform X2 [Andrographis paniculata]